MKIKALSFLLLMIAALCPISMWADSSEGDNSMFTGLPNDTENSTPYESQTYGSENVTYLFDGTQRTKWTTALLKNGKYATAVFKSEKPVRFYGYTITTAQDDSRYPGRTPKTWKFYGWDEQSSSWVEIDSKVDQVDAYNGNYAEAHYDCTPAAKAYTKFKWVITDNHGGTAALSSGAADPDGEKIISLYDLDFDYIVEENNTWTIKDAKDLKAFATYVNAGNTRVNAQLLNDIDATDLGNAVMIGYKNQNDGSTSGNKTYRGTFDGLGYEIKINLTSTEKNTALFRCLGHEAVIRNLCVNGTITTSHMLAGGIAAFCYGPTIENCISKVTINTTVSPYGTHGGIVSVAHKGEGATTIKDCAFVGSITGTNTKSCSGIVGYGETECIILKNCFVHATFDIKAGDGNHTFYQNGLKSIENCYYTNALGDESMGTHVEVEELTNGSLRDKLNAGRNVWLQGTEYPEPFAMIDYLSFTAKGGDVTVTFKHYYNTKNDYFEYGIISDNDAQSLSVNWTTVSLGEGINIPQNSTIYFRAKAKISFGDNERYQFAFTSSSGGHVEADGNIMSLLDPTLQQMDVPEAVFGDLFNGCTLLYTAPKLPATTLGNHCYACMFSGCSNLRQAPVLPATNIESGYMPYKEMFKDCSSLEELHLLAVSLGEQGDMFNGINTTGTLYGTRGVYAQYKAGDFTIPANWKFVLEEGVPDFYDGEAYTAETAQPLPYMNYVRSFATAGTWQALYIPFSITVSSKTMALYDIAQVYMVSTAGSLSGSSEGDGADVIVVRKLAEGDSTIPNTPYFIRPKKTGDTELLLGEITLAVASAGNPVSCATTLDEYNFIGSYAVNFRPSEPVEWYTLNGGSLHKMVGESALLGKAQRWYMTKASKSGGYNPAAPVDSQARDIRIMTLGEEDETTGITLHESDLNKVSPKNSATGIYTLTGVYVGNTISALPAGVYVKNGQKFVVTK